MLEVRDINVYYGKIHALKGVSLSVKRGEIVSIVGANGAGKSTLMMTIAGILKPKNGKIMFENKEIPPLSHKVAEMGIILVPERRRLFANLTVKENLLLGAFLRKDKEEIRRDMEYIYTLFPILKQRERQFAGTLSGGEQQMLALGRGLMAKPRILLLDEPSLGLSPLFTKEVFSSLVKINMDGVTILLSEQNANKALQISHKAYILETGRVVLSGTGMELLENQKIREAYLGVK
ncbi:ABC transporter ATP-binding protein [Thermovenabulum gondwanense]|uniref:High-affinity branched-chain amino acid transport ATP-binding protein LivF n=1 Tax=Thermovenabulum gondwanense TaxID=520767 RepID=A0A162MS49_9FIRM|nr:ABC transporter ATP-binding protein [Thermovenabulum gondwanense]KYO67057.1 High-affinity branched-chain amino acid transport ATP-binding protein LivF [Thermovenabulum gondwanense]